MAQTYDAVVIGAGLSGLSLACRLLTEPTGVRTLALVDPAPLRGADRAWASWGRGTLRPVGVPQQEWRAVRTYAAGRGQILDLAGYRYRRLRNVDLERHAATLFARTDRVTVVAVRATAVRDGRHGAVVVTDDGTISGRWVFDSRPRARPVLAVLSFTGWFVTTPEPAFDAVPTLFDFRTAQAGAGRFMYVLPLERDRALVEHTSFATGDDPAGFSVEDALSRYLSEVLGQDGYEVTGTEAGQIGLGPGPSRVLGRHVLAIGQAGGMVKPSTGYGCGRIQRDSGAIARSLARHGDPFALPAGRRRHRYLDSVLLRALRTDPGVLEHAFAAMFEPGRLPTSLRFLDEDSRYRDEGRLLTWLPVAPFARAAGGLAVDAVRRRARPSATRTGRGTPA